MHKNVVLFTKRSYRKEVIPTVHYFRLSGPHRGGQYVSVGRFRRGDHTWDVWTTKEDSEHLTVDRVRRWLVWYTESSQKAVNDD